MKGITMNKLILSTLLLAFSAVATASPVFECIDKSGRKTYTQTGGKNCKPGNIGRPSVYTSAAPSAHSASASAASRNAPSEQMPPPPAGAMPGSSSAQNELAQAQKNLEEGKQVRYGNERNYARYQERIKSLENQVKAAQERVNAANSMGGEGEMMPEY